MTVQMRDDTDTTGTLRDEESRIQNFVHQMLVTRIFVACYIGRFYVNHLKSYRDVLKIQNEENETIRYLYEVKKRIFDYYKGAVWPAITGPDSNEVPMGHCIWSNLDKHLPLNEPNWFLIQNVAISAEGELLIKIKHLRNVNTEVESPSMTTKSNEVDWTWSLLQTRIKHNIMTVVERVITWLEGVITWHNMKESVRFLFLLLMTVATVMLNSLQYLGDYSIRFFREFNNLIKVSTPILLSIVDLVSKTIGGILILISMLFRRNPQVPRPQEPFMPRLMPGAPYRRQFRN